MAGDERRMPDAGGGGKRGGRRTRESMKAAGVTDEAITLVETLVEVLDQAWPTRQAFLAHVNQAEKTRLDRKQLSKELGGSAKPNGPEWHVADLIARHCVRADLETFRARIAGLFCAARGVQHPPGYDGRIIQPARSTGEGAAAAATTTALNRIQLELDKKTGEVEQLRAICDGTYRKLADQQAMLDRQHRDNQTLKEQLLATLSSLESHSIEVEKLTGKLAARSEELDAVNAQVANLTAQGLATATELGRVGEQNAALEDQIAAQEGENSRLTHELLAQSAQHVREITDARKIIAVQQGSLQEAAGRLAQHEVMAADVEQRHSTLREQHARLAAEVELHLDLPMYAPPYPWPPYPDWMPFPPPPSAGLRLDASTHEAPPGSPWPPSQPAALGPWAPGMSRRRTMPGTNSRWLSPLGYGAPSDPWAEPAALPTAHRGNSPLAAKFNSWAPPQWRQLAVYLLVHCEHSDQSVWQRAELTGLRSSQVEGILTARLLPSLQQLTVIADAVGAEAAYAKLLHDQAVVVLPPPPPREVPISGMPAGPGLHSDMYESIVAGFNGDNDGDTGPLPPIVAVQRGDSDMSPSDTRDSASCADWVSPPKGDKAVTTHRDAQLIPRLVIEAKVGRDGQVVAPAQYQSRSSLRSQRRHQWIRRSVTATAAILMSAILALAAHQLAAPGMAPMVLLGNLVACFTCWAIAAGVPALMKRSRVGYRGRHSPGGCSPKPATATGRAFAMSEDHEDPRSERPDGDPVVPTPAAETLVPPPSAPVDRAAATAPLPPAPAPRQSQDRPWQETPDLDAVSSADLGWIEDLRSAKQQNLDELVEDLRGNADQGTAPAESKPGNPDMLTDINEAG